MTLTRESVSSSATGGAVNLESARRQYRARAAAMGSGIVSVEPVLMPSGVVALEVITKRRHGLGFGFEGLLSIVVADHEYALTISADERMTGVREALVNGQMLQLGEIQIDEILREPADRSTGARPVPGMKKDPYDPEYDDEAFYAASDDPRLDPLFPEHPLTIIRAGLLGVRTSWIWDAQPKPDSSEHTAVVSSSGPRSMLSNAALREVYWSAGRADLLEVELKAAIASADPRGDSDDPEVARLLMMLGLVQQNSNNALKARVTLLRAVAILEKAPPGEHHRDIGVALGLLGRTQQLLSRTLDAEQSFRRSIEILEKFDTGLALLHALAQYGQILATQNRMAEAAPIAARVQQLLANGQKANPLALLRELVGGAPAGVTTEIMTFPRPKVFSDRR